MLYALSEVDMKEINTNIMTIEYFLQLDCQLVVCEIVPRFLSFSPRNVRLPLVGPAYSSPELSSGKQL